MALSGKAQEVIMLLVLCLPAFTLSTLIKRSSNNVFTCCVLEDPRCNTEKVATSRWLLKVREKRKEYRYYEVRGPGNSLAFRNKIQEEGYWRCSLEFVNGNITEWSGIEIFLATNITSEPQEVILDATSEKLEYQYKFNIGELTQKQELSRVRLYYSCDPSSTYTLLYKALDSNYSLSERISIHGNSVFLSNFTVILNWTEVQALVTNISFCIGFSIRVNDVLIHARANILLDCTKKDDIEATAFHLDFTRSNCTKYKDGSVIEYLLMQETCLKSDFSVSMQCDTDQNTGTLTVFASRTLLLQSLQRALQTIAHVSSEDPPPNNSYSSNGSSAIEGTTVSELNPSSDSTLPFSGMVPSTTASTKDSMTGSPTSVASDSISDSTPNLTSSTIKCDISERDFLLKVLLCVFSLFIILLLLFITILLLLCPMQYVRAKSKVGVSRSMSPCSHDLNLFHELVRHQQAAIIRQTLDHEASERYHSHSQAPESSQQYRSSCSNSIDCLHSRPTERQEQDSSNHMEESSLEIQEEESRHTSIPESRFTCSSQAQDYHSSTMEPLDSQGTCMPEEQQPQQQADKYRKRFTDQDRSERVTDPWSRLRPPPHICVTREEDAAKTFKHPEDNNLQQYSPAHFNQVVEDDHHQDNFGSQTLHPSNEGTGCTNRNHPHRQGYITDNPTSDYSSTSKKQNWATENELLAGGSKMETVRTSRV